MIHTMQNEQGVAIRARAFSERTAALNVLNALRRAVLDYTTAALEASAPELRRMFERMAGEAMQSYEQLVEVMRQNRLYTDAAPAASVQEVMMVSQRCMDVLNNMGRMPNEPRAAYVQAPNRANQWQPAYYSYAQQPQTMQQPPAAQPPYGVGFGRPSGPSFPFGGGGMGIGMGAGSGVGAGAGAAFAAPPVAPPRLPEFAQPHAFPFGGMPQGHYAPYQASMAAGMAPQQGPFTGAQSAMRAYPNPQMQSGGFDLGAMTVDDGFAPSIEDKQPDVTVAAEAKPTQETAPEIPMTSAVTIDAAEEPAPAANKRNKRTKAASAVKEEQGSTQL